MILSFLLLYDLQKNAKGTERFIRALLMWQVIVLFGVNFLNFGANITETSIRLYYTGIVITLLVIKLLYKRTIKYNFIEQMKKIDGYQICLIILGIFVLLVSVLHVPYNWDSMTYHLPRLASWEQFQSINHYATNIDRQIFSPTLAAYTNLFVYILGGMEVRLLNLTQTIFYFANAYLVYGLAIRIGVRKKLAYFAALLFMTMPIALTEAVTTQVDHYATVWALAFVYISLELIEQTSRLILNKRTFVCIVSLALCVAFGYLAKPSVCFAMLSFLIVLVVKCMIRKDRIWVLIQSTLIAAVTMSVPILSEWIRNIHSIGSITASNVGARQLVGTLQPSYLLINFIRNITWNIIPIFPMIIRKKITDGITWLATLLGVEMNSSLISEDGRTFEYLQSPNYNCDSAVNVIIGIGVLLAIILFARTTKKFTTTQKAYIIASFAVYVIFCTVIRWHPFITRYMIPYLALLCPMIVIILQEGFNCSKVHIRKTIIDVAATIGILYFSGMMYSDNGLVITFENVGYFNYGYEDVFVDYQTVSDYIVNSDYKKVGLKLNGDTYEFPIWRMLGENVQEVRHIMVGGALQQYDDATFSPDCIWLETVEVLEQIEYNDHVYFMNDDISTEFIKLYEIKP